MKHLTIVVPCYNEEQALGAFCERVFAVTENLNIATDFVFVDDGSTDGTGAALAALSRAFDHVKTVTLSRNFGKDAALLAGLRAATGDYVAMMDADLQDPPELLGDMLYALSAEGYAVAAAHRVSRKGDPKVRSFLSDRFYASLRASKADVKRGARDFRMMTREALEAVLALREHNRFSKGILGYVGYRTKWISFENATRVAGKTKYSMKKLFSYAADGIFDFTRLPLLLVNVCTLFLCLLTLGFGITFVVQACLRVDFSLMLTLAMICGVGFLLMLGVWVAVQYLSRIYAEVKNRPDYFTVEGEKPNKNPTDEQ